MFNTALLLAAFMKDLNQLQWIWGFGDSKPLKFSRSEDSNARIFLFINILGDSDVSSTHLEKTNCIWASGVPATQEVEIGGLFESRSSNSAWATVQDPHLKKSMEYNYAVNVNAFLTFCVLAYTSCKKL